MSRSDVGNGPPCPYPGHGRLYLVTRGRATPGREFWCPHSGHGGNGKFFSYKEARGEYELKESDVTTIFDSAVREIVAGTLTLEQAVKDIAESTSRSPSQVRESINIMLDVVRANKEKREEMATQAKAKAKPAKAAAPKAARKTLEHVAGPEFARVRDELGLTNKQAAEATAAAGMGASPTYIYIVTHQGSSIELFKRYDVALRAYAKSHAAEIKAAAKESAAKATAKATPKAAPAKAAPKAAPAKAAKAPAKAASAGNGKLAAARARASSKSAPAPVATVSAAPAE